MAKFIVDGLKVEWDGLDGYDIVDQLENALYDYGFFNVDINYSESNGSIMCEIECENDECLEIDDVYGLLYMMNSEIADLHLGIGFLTTVEQID